MFEVVRGGMSNGVCPLSILVGTIEVCAIHFNHERRAGRSIWC